MLHDESSLSIYSNINTCANRTQYHIILTYLQSWRNGLIPNSHHPISIQEPIQDIIDQQQDIRWQSVFTGWTTAEWECLQPAYYAAICSWKPEKRWLICIITKLWQVAWDMWDQCTEDLHPQEKTVDARWQQTLASDTKRAYHSLRTFQLSPNHPT